MAVLDNSSFKYALDTNNSDTFVLYNRVYAIRTCFLPIVILGTVTNAFNFSILLRRDMRFLSTTVYLFALAVADIGVMYFELFRIWFEWANLVPPEMYFTGTYCKLANYMNGVTRDFSNWLIACLTFERLIMMTFPFKAKYLCTVSTARKVILFLLLLLCLPHIHYLVNSVPIEGRFGWTCWEDQSKPVAVLVSIIIDFVFGYFVIVVVFMLNILLVFMICRSKPPYMTSCKGPRATKNRRLTHTLIAIALMFIICETPRMIMAIVIRYLERTAEWRIIFNITYVISGLNHACNFFIYILTSPRFRLLVLKTFPLTLFKCNKNQQVMRTTGSSNRGKVPNQRPTSSRYELKTTFLDPQQLSPTNEVL